MSALARIKKTAAQHEQDRQYDKALALYARLLDGAEAGEEEVDVALYNRAGDLALRLGDAPRAVGYFERALDLYAASGLLNNAVALGVKILRHAPNHLSAHYTLGVLYGRKGFVGDARHHLLTYAVQMQRAGRADETARVLGEVAATCGDATELRAAFDAYGALGGDLAHAAALASGPTAPSTAPQATPGSGTPGSGTPVWGAPAIDAARGRAVDPAFLDLTPAGGVEALVDGASLELEPAVAGDALAFLDVPLEDAGAGEVAPAAVAAAATPGAWQVTLPNEPPPLRLADLADRPARLGAPASLDDGPADLPPVPPALDKHTLPGGAFDGGVVDLAPFDLGSADLVPPPDAPDAETPADVPLLDLGVPVAARAPRADAPPPAPAPGADDGLDLGAWLRDSTPEESTRMTTAAVPQSGDEQADFDATLRAFTAGVRRVVGHEDFDSHYDLGVAFREMGLVDEAIVQFQRAAQAPGRPLRVLEALAQCFLDQEQPELALSTLAGPAAAADAAGAGDASLVAVHYLMGAAAQALGRPDDARRYLVRVVATDVRFRDASSRLAALPPPALTR